MSLFLCLPDCGTKKEKPHGGDYIYNGEDAEDGEVPWQAAVMLNMNLLGGGTVVGRRHVITAAHVVHQRDKDYIHLLLGTNGIGTYKGFRVTIEEIKIHPEYNDDSLENDIAVLIVSKNIEMNYNSLSVVRPACLPALGSSINDFMDLKGTVSGWGKMNSTSNSNTYYLLQKGTVQVLGKKCGKFITGEDLPPNDVSDIKPGMFCAGETTNEEGLLTDTCSGDSGGPLTVQDKKNNNAETLIGATSWGHDPCSAEGFPGVYVDISYYIQDRWLQTALDGLDTCPPPPSNGLPTPSPITTTAKTTPTKKTTTKRTTTKKTSTMKTTTKKTATKKTIIEATTEMSTTESPQFSFEFLILWIMQNINVLWP